MPFNFFIRQQLSEAICLASFTSLLAFFVTLVLKEIAFLKPIIEFFHLSYLMVIIAFIITFCATQKFYPSNNLTEKTFDDITEWSARILFVFVLIITYVIFFLITRISPIAIFSNIFSILIFLASGFMIAVIAPIAAIITRFLYLRLVRELLVSLKVLSLINSI